MGMIQPKQPPNLLMAGGGILESENESSNSSLSDIPHYPDIILSDIRERRRIGGEFLKLRSAFSKHGSYFQKLITEITNK